MIYYTVKNLKKMFLDFFCKKKYSVIPGSSLVPQNDKSILYTPAGMHPLMSYLSGDLQHPAGAHLVNVQKVVRTGAIEQVGVDACFTFFELLGSWSLGQYDKLDMIQNALEFLTGEQYLGIPKELLYITYFSGNEREAPDVTTYDCWKKCKMSDDHIIGLVKNWKGPYGPDGLSGPNTKIFYDTGKPQCSASCKPSCNCGKYIELWDIVFFTQITRNGVLEELQNKSIDTGMGLERIAALSQGVDTVYETDLFKSITDCVEQLCSCPETFSERYVHNIRVIADHFRCIVFILGDEITTVPSSTGRGYVLRKIIRRAIKRCDELDINEAGMKTIIQKIISVYADDYPILNEKNGIIYTELKKEIIKYREMIVFATNKFKKTLKHQKEIQMCEIENANKTYGLPVDDAIKICADKGIMIV